MKFYPRKKALCVDVCLILKFEFKFFSKVIFFEYLNKFELVSKAGYCSTEIDSDRISFEKCSKRLFKLLSPKFFSVCSHQKKCNTSLIIFQVDRLNRIQYNQLQG